MMNKFPQEVLDVLTQIHNKGYEAYLVGGCVRDRLLDIETLDFDINTNATTEILSKLFIDYSPMIYETYGNVSFKLDEYSIEITRYRKEGKYRKHRHPSSVNFDATLKHDLQRRDFTMNALTYHPKEGFGGLKEGFTAIERREIKTISKPNTSFNEDYLRMLRAVRFASKLDFSIEAQTLKVLKKNYHRIKELGLGQIEAEFLDFLNAKHFKEFVLENPWSLTELMPELKEAYGFDQNNKYHSYDLFEHTIHTVSHCDTLELKVAALFHDLGKLRSKRVNDNGTFSFPDHSKESLKIIDRYFSEWNMNGLNKETIRKLIIFHDLSIPVDYIEMKKLVHLNDLEFMRKLIAIKRADNLSKSEEAAYQVEKCNVYDGFLDQIESDKPPVKLKDLDISGDELGVEPRLRGKILNELMLRVIEGQVDNKKIELFKEVLRINDELH